MVRDEKDDKLALEALWALYVSGGLHRRPGDGAPRPPVDHVRAWTVRLLGDRRQVAPRFNDRLVELAEQRAERDGPEPARLHLQAAPRPGRPADRGAAAGAVRGRRRPPDPLALVVGDRGQGHLRPRAGARSWSARPTAWNRPITRAFIVERLARRYLAEGTPDGYATCARLLGLAPTPAERERLVRAMEQQMEGLHLDKAPEALASALGPLLASDHPSSALVRLSLRLGLEPAYPLAAARAADREAARRPSGPTSSAPSAS